MDDPESGSAPKTVHYGKSDTLWRYYFAEDRFHSFGIKIPDEETSSIATVKDAIDKVAEKLA